MILGRVSEAHKPTISFSIELASRCERARPRRKPGLRCTHREPKVVRPRGKAVKIRLADIRERALELGSVNFDLSPKSGAANDTDGRYGCGERDYAQPVTNLLARRKDQNLTNGSVQARRKR
jgi:hypothetical protein